MVQTEVLRGYLRHGPERIVAWKSASGAGDRRLGVRFTNDRHTGMDSVEDIRPPRLTTKSSRGPLKKQIAKADSNNLASRGGVLELELAFESLSLKAVLCGVQESSGSSSTRL